MRALWCSQRSPSFARGNENTRFSCIRAISHHTEQLFTPPGRSLLLVNWPEAPAMLGVSPLLWCRTTRLLLGIGVWGWGLLRGWSSYFCLYKRICLGNGLCFCPQHRLLVPGEEKPKTKRRLCTRLLASTTGVNVHLAAEVFVCVFSVGGKVIRPAQNRAGSEWHLSITARHKVTSGCRTPGPCHSLADVHGALQNRRETSAWIHWKYRMTAQQKLVL